MSGESDKNCPRWGQFSLRRPKPDRLLETAVGRARAGRDGVRWQGLAQACPAPCLGLTLRARARKEEQRRQSAPSRPARVCSAFTHEVMDIVGRNVCIHAVSPAEESGQLRFLG